MTNQSASVSPAIDPQLLADGMVLAGAHMEAGCRSIADLTSALAADLEIEPARFVRYLEAWYLGARAMLRAAGHDLAGTDGLEAAAAFVAGMAAAQSMSSPQTPPADPEGDDDTRIRNACYEAVLRFGAARLEKLGEKVIWHMRRAPASGIWGDDYGYRTLWDEYCHDVQEGPFDEAFMEGLPSVSSAFDMSALAYIEQQVDALDREEAILLTFRAVESLDDPDTADMAGSMCREGLISAILAFVREEAGNADLWRFQNF